MHTTQEYLTYERRVYMRTHEDLTTKGERRRRRTLFALLQGYGTNVKFDVTLTRQYLIDYRSMHSIALFTMSRKWRSNAGSSLEMRRCRTNTVYCNLHSSIGYLRAQSTQFLSVLQLDEWNWRRLPFEFRKDVESVQSWFSKPVSIDRPATVNIRVACRLHGNID